MFRIFKVLWRGLWPEKIEGFQRGDIVRLKHANPHKGNLSADNYYVILGIGRHGKLVEWVFLRHDNFALATFPADLFELASEPIHKGTANRWSAEWKNKRCEQLRKKRERERERKKMLAHWEVQDEEYKHIIRVQEMLK